MTKKFIKVFGERNTGTRAIISMLNAVPHLSTGQSDFGKSEEFRRMKQRISDRVREKWVNKYLEGLIFDHRGIAGGAAAWKHVAPYFDESFSAADAHVIFTVRNPYSWVLALVNRPYNAQGVTCASVEQFVDHPWITKPKDRIAQVIESPLGFWNEKLRAYRKFQEQCDIPFASLTFEGFVSNPVKVLGAALTEMGVNPEGLVEIEHSTKDSSRTIDDIRAYYKNEKWKIKLSRQSVVLINSFTDWEVANNFGYQKLNPKDFPISLPESVQIELDNQFASKSRFHG